jgi:C2 domain
MQVDRNSSSSLTSSLSSNTATTSTIANHGGGLYAPWHLSWSEAMANSGVGLHSWTSLDEEEEDEGAERDSASSKEEESVMTMTSVTPAATATAAAAAATTSAAASLEGILYWRKGRKSRGGGSALFWKRRHVVLDFKGKSLAAFRLHSSDAAKDHSKSSQQLQVQLQRRLSSKHSRIYTGDDARDSASTTSSMAWFLSSAVDWQVKDIANDSSCFVVEVMSPMAIIGDDGESSTADAYSSHNDGDVDFTTNSLVEEEEDEDAATSTSIQSTAIITSPQQPSLRFYLKCRNGGNEKVLWLKAFAKLERLSTDLRIKKSLLSNAIWKAPQLSYTRTRTSSSAALAKESMQLEQLNLSTETESAPIVTSLPQVQHHKREKEHRVIPQRCYPNLWMTDTELLEEMERPSETVHDLSQNQCRLDLPNNPSNKNIIGTLQLEVLQGLGFPKLDRYSKTDAVVYVVSGPYAFCTEVIKDKQSPIWLSKSQRACSIPLHHAYARVYIGVFDDEKNTKDDFNGRVVLDVARLRPNSTYDVTLPLRLSAHVYSRRQRGAIRIRFRLEWTSVRSALLSYLPDPMLPKLPLRIKNLKEFQPNTDTVVPCGSLRAFRNVAITVHGSHLPGRFSFQQLRATIREINFTRKTVMQIVKTTIIELREWHNPLISAFVFCAWMHAIWQNAFSLVPAYLMCYLWILLMRNYARYGMDGPAQRGFLPPSWEELLQGLLVTSNKDQAIRPLDMNLRPTQHGNVQYTVQTHEPRGKGLFRAIGFLEPNGAEQAPNYDLEFPYADGNIYPRFDVEHALVNAKKRGNHRISANKKKSNHAPKSKSQRLKLGITKIMRVGKDVSGMNDYDAEEQRFATAKFIRQTGATQLMGAATGLMDVGETLGEATGLQYVVSPVIKGGHYMVSPVLKGGQSAVMGGLHYVVPPIKSGIKTGYSGIETGIRGINNHVVSPLVVSPLHHTVDLVRRTCAYTDDDDDNDEDVGDVDQDSLPSLDEPDDRAPIRRRSLRGLELQRGLGRMPSIAELEVESDDNGDDMDEMEDVYNSSAPPSGSDSSSAEPGRMMQPDQDIDFDGGNSKGKNRKRLTDDLQDVKDQMHQFTFQNFNDSAYVIRDSDSHYFGHAAPAGKQREGAVKKDLDKLLQIGQYSHSNPVVGRVGQYVEPIVGASHSFLSAFRALFNVMTWRDPFLTFWVSLLGFALVALLFVFPWRLFLFLLGLWFVGPQNLVYRILRQRGILPPKKPRTRPSRGPEEMQVPSDQVVFQGHISQEQKRRPHKPADPQEVQYVVVPYSPLMYQRFYDWPPEQEYSQVYSRNHVTADASAASNGYFSSSVAEGKKTK